MESKNTHCKWCSAYGCSNSKNKRPDLSFFRFPSDPDRCKKWVINTRRADLLTKSVDALSRSNVLCSEHFEASCFVETSANRKRRRLRKTALPTIFNVPNPPLQLTSSRPPPKKRTSEIPENTKALTSSSIPCPPTSSEDHSITSNEIKSIKRKLNQERVKNSRFRKKLKLSHQQTEHSTTRDEEAVLKNVLERHLPDAAVQFILTQIRVSKLSVRGRRWTPQDKSFALSCYHASRKAYKLLQKVFTLPSPRTLRSSLKNLSVYPGFCQSVLSLLKIKVDTMNACNKVCSISFDEMSIKKSLAYDPVNDQIDGFEDFGNCGRSKNPANHALVFMARGLYSNWKQPFAYTLSSGPTKCGMLQLLILEAVSRLLEIGLCPKVIICDQGSNNRAALKSLDVSTTQPFLLTGSHKTFVMFDPPHLIKNIRNNFKTHGFEMDGKAILWDHVRKFYEHDSVLPIRMAPKLSRRHIELPNFAKLRVSLAVQVLSHTVAAGVSTMVSFGTLSHEASATAQFIERFDQIFNCFNSRGFHSTSTMGHAVTEKSSHMQFVKEAKEWLLHLKCKNKSGNLPCLEGWLLSCNTLELLWQDLKENFAFRFLLTSRLNQDCLENLFSVIRGKGGHRFNPDSREFRASLRQTMVDSVMSTSENQNCKDDLDTSLFSLKHVAANGFSSAEPKRLERDVPKVIQEILRNTAPDVPDSNAEQNILAYICGYIVLKLRGKVCTKCLNVISSVRDFNNPAHAFINQKNFARCEQGGLQAPSRLLLETCMKAEKLSGGRCTHVCTFQE